MSNLVPDVRVNKLGVPVIKHVRASAAPNALKTMIPPPQPVSASTPSSGRKGSFKPAATQKKQFSGEFKAEMYHPDDQLREAFLASPVPLELTTRLWTASDVQAYSILSRLDIDDAVSLALRGFDTEDKMLGFLNENNLMHLLKDRSTLTDAALERKVKSPAFCTGVKLFGARVTDTDLLMDVCLAYDSATLRNMRLSREKPIVERVIDGELSMSDIETVGVSRIAKSNMADRIIESLEKVQAGTTDLTAEQVKNVVDKYQKENVLAHVGVTALTIAERFGGSLVTNLKSLYSTAQMYAWLNEKNKKFSEPFIRDMLEYNDAMDRISRNNQPKFGAMVNMYRSGMPAGKAAELLESGFTPSQVIAARREGISTHVAEGWL